MYSYTWKKYLPVIRLHLKKAMATEQIVALNRTDFERTTKTRKPACSFSVEVDKGRLSALNQSVPARNLLEILKEDPACNVILRAHHFTISLNSDFKLTLTNSTPSDTEELAEEKTASAQ
jgi:hypothetical protein